MESTLGKMFEDLQKSTREEFFDLLHYVRVSQVKGSFFLLIRRKEVKYLVGGEMKCLGLYKI